jgi:hypothetical protein
VNSQRVCVQAWYLAASAHHEFWVWFVMDLHNQVKMEVWEEFELRDALVEENICVLLFKGKNLLLQGQDEVFGCLIIILRLQIH